MRPAGQRQALTLVRPHDAASAAPAADRDFVREPPLDIVRCPIHGIAYDDELEQCPECAKGATRENKTSALYLRVQVRLDRLTPTDRARFVGKTFTIVWDQEIGRASCRERV